MYACVFYVFGDGVFDYFSVLCDGVELYLVGLCHELGDDDWIFLADFAGHLEEALKLFVVVAYVHGCA